MAVMVSHRPFGFSGTLNPNQVGEVKDRAQHVPVLMWGAGEKGTQSFINKAAHSAGGSQLWCELLTTIHKSFRLKLAFFFSFFTFIL